MLITTISLIALSTLLPLTGCFIGDRVLERRVTFNQSITTGNVDQRTFQIDTTALPPDWIESEGVEDTRGGKEEWIQLGSHPVKIILVPAE